MDHVPTEILVEIFSYIRPPQLLRVERVCHRWHLLVQENFWNQLECVTEETIDYPNGDYLNNFIRLSAHLVRVKEFIDPFALLKDFPSHKQAEAQLCATTLDLVRKLSPGALFPLDVIQNVVNYQLNVKSQARKQSRETKADLESNAIQAIIQATINDVVNQTPLHKFRSIRINQLFVHSKEKDPFVIRWEGEQVAVPVDLKKITRLVIGCLVIRLSWYGEIHEDAIPQVFDICNRMSEFTCLKVIEIETVHMLMYPNYGGQEPNFDMILEFGQDHREFSRDNFDSLLESRNGLCSYGSDLDMAQCIQQWRNEGRVKRVELRVAQEYFRKMNHAFTHGKGVSGSLDNPFQLLMHQVVHSLVDVLHLTYERNGEENDILETLELKGALSRLKSLSISFAYAGGWGSLLEVWGTVKGVAQVRRILHTVKNNLNSLESLTLRFTAGGTRCPSNLFSPTGVTVQSGSFPRLVSLDCIGLACLPFIVSVVSRAPNLRRLSVGCQPFEEDQVGLDWIMKLIECLDACPRLAFLQIAVQHEDKLGDAEGWRKGPRQAKCEKEQRDISKCRPQLNAIEERLQSLHPTLSNLSHLSVTFDTLDYSFGSKKERKCKNWNREELVARLPKGFFQTKGEMQRAAAKKPRD